ncbi:hypothetical protein LTR10_016016 [Elasticomyces elasticus]|uniref:Amino acid permease/ SLC12A domain-containing protein n=1 Tax=Exophiala sideris TaxID=1016849 RepID=A0ABR0J3M4_9EURO|nr:hypothetical protein LTR10_016016 [Elasticomyces elasticus]KAK5024646.1 hypothetical protein LTS07_008492 [Exophiala sideris]KAK5030739.1 hypothetical protein LTR13_008093 [Exophiala sideris]KAK5054279.1 hypothetical protein LTR69_008894 [Exophiala sideris]KAK5179681.1 hypothetical protein LTR44_007849 [Eurotiomycetes sp. CCFEE 6388]
MHDKAADEVQVHTPVDSERGTLKDVTNDALQLASLGHTEELERNFSLFALIGLGFVCSGSWSGVAQSLVAGVNSGGPAVLVYGAYVFTDKILSGDEA